MFGFGNYIQTGCCGGLGDLGGRILGLAERVRTRYRTWLYAPDASGRLQPSVPVAAGTELLVGLPDGTHWRAVGTIGSTRLGADSQTKVRVQDVVPLRLGGFRHARGWLGLGDAASTSNVPGGGGGTRRPTSRRPAEDPRNWADLTRELLTGTAAVVHAAEGTSPPAAGDVADGESFTPGATTPFYKTPLGMVAIAGAVVLLGGGIYLATKKEKVANRRRRRRAARRRNGAGEATELKLYIDNDGDLYRRMTTYVYKNLVTKMARGTYDPARAAQAFAGVVEAGAKKYMREFGEPSTAWHRIFDASTRREVAAAMARDFEAEAALGNYDNLLPKKYRDRAALGQVRNPPYRVKYTNVVPSRAAAGQLYGALPAGGYRSLVDVNQRKGRSGRYSTRRVLSREGRP